MSPIYRQFVSIVNEYPSKVALVDGDVNITYEQLLAYVDSWANSISANCGNTRPRVVLLVEQQLHNICISLAIAKIGGCCIPINSKLMPSQLSEAFISVDTNLVICSSSQKSKLTALPLQANLLVADEQQPSNHSELVEINQAWLAEPDYLITLSSGSTGDPKPIMLSQTVKLARAQQTWKLYKLTPDDVVLCASPFFHSLGQRLTFVPLLIGATMIHQSSFTPLGWLTLVEKYHVTFVISVSSHLYALKNQLLDNAEQLKSLRAVVTSSAPIDSQFKAQVFEAIGCDFYEIYGATEVAVATNLAPSDASIYFQTVGTACHQVELQIFDAQNKPVSGGEIGQIAVKTPLAFSGYYGRDNLSKMAIHLGYFLTGDLGFLDDNGFLTYVGRQKDLIISGGINIYPKDIETVLLKNSRVEEVAVIGVEDTLLGEVIVAVCICSDSDSDKLELQLRKQANLDLAPFQRPLKYFFPAKLPLTATGKVSKKALREQYTKLNNGWTEPLRLMLYGATK